MWWWGLMFFWRVLSMSNVTLFRVWSGKVNKLWVLNKMGMLWSRVEVMAWTMVGIEKLMQGGGCVMWEEREREKHNGREARWRERRESTTLHPLPTNRADFSLSRFLDDERDRRKSFLNPTLPLYFPRLDFPMHWAAQNSLQLSLTLPFNTIPESPENKKESERELRGGGAGRLR